MNKKKKITVTVGIPAYYTEKNIGNLLISLLEQEQIDFNLDRIIVYNDCSGDNTLKQAKKVKNNKIDLIDGKVRKGFAYGVKTLIAKNKSDVLLLLNDDIKILDANFLNKLIQPFINEKKIGLVCGNPQPLKPISFIDKALASRLKASELLSYKINNGSNVFSCDGKILALSATFINKLKLPKNNNDLGNVDAYLYFACITTGFLYRFIRDANVYYRNPTTWKDYSKWISRNNSQKYILLRNFNKKMVNKEYTKPKILLLQTLFNQLLINPVGSIFVILTEAYNVAKARFYMKNSSGTWKIIKTTKNLDS